MRILYLTSEAYPLVKTGGLADVAGALPRALREAGEDVRMVLPAYPSVLDRAEGKGVRVSVGDPLGIGETGLIPARLPGSDQFLWLVDNPIYDRAGGPYVDSQGEGWRDNHIRFALLSRVAAMITVAGGFLGWKPDIVHANDWQTGLVPAYLARWDGVVTPTVFTIHNLHYQGNFDPWVLSSVALPPEMFSLSGVEFFGRVSFMKAGLQYSRKITTVSPTYAREIQTPELGMGFNGLLASRSADLHGILNGVDYDIWNSAADPHIPARYSASRMAGKAECKTALQRELNLTEDPNAPLIGMVTRMTGEKGLDLVLDALQPILETGAQLAILGAGDSYLERSFAVAAAGKPGRVGTRIGFDEPLAHRIQAGSDMLLVPSRSEPCGLTQLYALRYGTLPIVRHTGGLADTVIDIGDMDLGTGLVFGAPDPNDLIDAIRRGVELFARKTDWRKVQKRAMSEDFSWLRAARGYAALYRDML